MDTQPLDDRELSLASKLEALLFVASGSTSVAQLATAIGITTQEVERGLTELQDHYLESRGRARDQDPAPSWTRPAGFSARSSRLDRALPRPGSLIALEPGRPGGSGYRCL